MGRAIDRLPADFAEPRKPRREPRGELTEDATTAALTLHHNNEATHWKAWQAITKLHGDGVIDFDTARELCFAFGLDALSRPKEA
jgi:hypothetical protein